MMSFKIQQQCRVCMQFYEQMTDIFSGMMETENGELKSVREAFEEVTGVAASEEDEITSLICLICINRLKDAVNLRLLTEVSYRKFIEMRDTQNASEKYDVSNIKTEDIAVDAEEELSMANLDDQYFEDESMEPSQSEEVLFSLTIPHRIGDDNENNNDGTKEERKKCLVCKLDFKSQRELNRHLCTQSDQITKTYERFGCTICPKEFLYRSLLARHMRTHSEEKPFKCEFCPRSFSHSGSLTTHRHIHSKNRHFACQICLSKFAQRSALNRHLQTHSKERPFACNFCKNTYKRQDDLKVHIRVHTNELPYTCQECSKGFRSSSNLNRHTRTEHRDIYLKENLSQVAE